MYYRGSGEAFGIDPRNVQSFLAHRTAEGDIIVMKCHQKAREVIKEINPEIKVGITMSLYDYQAIPGGEEYLKQMWDEDRIEFLEKAINGLYQCVEDGINVIGYMHWSLMDNFQWQLEYNQKFGLIAVDRTTQTRYPKESLKVLGDIKKLGF